MAPVCDREALGGEAFGDACVNVLDDRIPQFEYLYGVVMKPNAVML